MSDNKPDISPPVVPACDSAVVATKNILALNIAAKSDREQVEKLTKTLRALEGRYTLLERKLDALQQQLMAFIAIRGRGGTQ